MQQKYVKLNQLNWKTHNDLNCLQVDLEQMTCDYAKMEESRLEQHCIITTSEKACQDFREHHVATHIEFVGEKQNLTTQIQD
jgi:hypothetical protein